jgi:hypothetical protein
MSTNYLALRSSAAPTLTVSTLLGSTIATRSISFQSTTISLGQSTTQSNNFSGGSFTTGWASTLTGTTSIKKVVLGNNGATQTILQNSGSTMSTVITSLNSGLTWAGSTMRGLPTSGALPYQTYGSTINAMPVPSITAITAAPSSGNQLAIASNDLVYASANSGATFTPQGLGQNNNPFIYMPFDGSSVADVMGNATVTATGSVGYVTGKVGANAVNINNSATVGLVPSQYLTGTWTGATNFTISFWFNSQSVPTTGQYQSLFVAYQNTVFIGLGTAGQITANMPSGGGSSAITLAGTGFNIAQNTWYNVTYVFQTNGVCSFFVNNQLIASVTNTGGTGTISSSAYTIGAQGNALAFNGYICDFRIYNYAVTNPSGAALINPLVGPIMPFVYLTFDGSTTTDVMGNSTVTATGSPGFVAGQVGSNALDLSTNTAGGTAGKYLSGTWAGTSNFTVSGWFNAQAIPASSVAMIFSAGTGAATAFQVYITTAGILTVYSSAAYTTSTTITTGTWYFFQVVYQSSGTCHVYLNGTQVTTFSGTTLSPIPTIFNVGVYTHTAATGAFRGYIDDLRIYNGAFLPSQLSPVLYSPSLAIGSPNIYLPFENGSVLDVMGYSAVSARGTMNFVPGVVGTTALNLVNPAGGTAVNYLRGSWAGSPNFTVSFWFNAQALGGPQQSLFAAYNINYVIYITINNQIALYIPSGGTAINIAFTSYTVSINTWYYVTAIFQTNGTCALYVNNSLIGSYTNSGGVGTYTSTAFAIGTYDIAQTNAFNGYIDDLKIYNCAVPFSALGPVNYTQAAISNSGAYQVVAAANGGVYTSANSGSSWSQPATAPAVAAAVNTVGGQVITPNLTGLASSGSALTTSPWIQNGVTWVASASSVITTLANFCVAFLFNNTQANNNLWANSAPNYTTSGNSSGQNTVIQGVTTATGDWIQIQSSVPLVMSSYQFGTGGSVPQLPKTYYIVGSTDGSVWYPIQYGSAGTVTTTASYTLVPNTIVVNSASTQTFGSSTITTTVYSTTTNAYTYFRLIGLTNYNGTNSYLEIGEWYINFATPSTPLYVAPSTALIANQSLSAITVMPQQTGLASNTWTTNGISWISSASSNLNASFFPYGAFNNYVGISGTYSWCSASGIYSASTGLITGTAVSTTILGGIGTISGEWLQIQSSVPLILSSYTYASGGNANNNPKTYIIVGSTDGTSWYPIQNVSMTTNPSTTQAQSCSTSIIVAQSGTQTIIGGQVGSGTFTTYATTTNAYLYFRFIGTSVYAGGGGNYQWGQLFLNFTAYTPALVNALTVSPTGQYMALTGAGATTPNLTGLAANTWTANGVSWTASASSLGYGGAYPAYNAFNNAYSSGNSFFTATNYNSLGTYTSSVSTTIQGGVPAQSGEWLQIQSSVPLVLTSYTGASAGYTGFMKSFFIAGSMDGTTWYPLQNSAFTTTPFTANFQLCTTYIQMNLTGTQTVIGGQTGSITTTAYSYTTQAWLYFRFIGISLFGTGATSGIDIGELYLNFQSGPTFYSTDYGSSWTRSLSAATIPNANVLATSGNGQYTLQASGQTVTLVTNTFAGYGTGTYTTPTFSPALTVNPVSNAAISATGQYMVVLIQSTTNNVYYSTNYGVSFTGLTVGSSPMVSCAVSADGTYITVASATQVFTLNWNTQGLTIALGNQAGLVNQAQNAIAIGNQAGQTNQSNNSIILNGSGAAVNSYVPGFYVAPVALAGSSVSGSFAVLGYGSDSQVVQSSSFFIGANGNVGIGTTSSTTPCTIYSSGFGTAYLSIYGPGSAGNTSGINISPWGGTLRPGGTATTIWALDDGAYSAHLLFGTAAPGAPGSNTMTERMRITSSGNVGIGTTSPQGALDVNGIIYVGTGANVGGQGMYINTGWVNSLNYNEFAPFQVAIRNTKVFVINTNGNVGIGLTNPVYPLSVQGHIQAFNTTNDVMGLFSPNYGNFLHIGAWNVQGSTSKNIVMNYLGGNVGIGPGMTNPGAPLAIRGPYVNDGVFQCYMTNSVGGVNILFAVDARTNSSSGGWSSSGAIALVARDTATNRSVNAAGTFNASGADYAEYMTKDSDFSALKGDLLGVLPSGKLTNQFDDAIHFLLKSTNPCMVGGDVWGTEEVVGEKPKEPENATEEEKAAHATALAAWESRLEAERQKVDRMAFAGQVPVNIHGTTPGDYIIPLRNADGTIGVAAVSKADMSFSQYQSAVGRVISILADGRANVIVKAV